MRDLENIQEAEADEHVMDSRNAVNEADLATKRLATWVRASYETPYVLEIAYCHQSWSIQMRKHFKKLMKFSFI